MEWVPSSRGQMNESGWYKLFYTPRIAAASSPTCTQKLQLTKQHVFLGNGRTLIVATLPLSPSST
eukprot:5224404-Pyramimonas_sp.AAC.1